MFKISIRLLINLISISFGVLLTSNLIHLLYEDGKLSISLKRYILSFKDFFTTAFDKTNWTYVINYKEYDLFPTIFEKFFDSMVIFVSAFLIGIFIAVILTFFISLFSKRFKKLTFGIITILESIPDLFVIISLQLLIVYVYKKTGILLGNIVSLGDDRAYLLPIICLSLLPTIHLFKITFLLMNEELNKPYVTVAHSKGLNKLKILFLHVFRNVMLSLLNHGKSIFGFTISNLFILEIVFNIHGIMSMMLYTTGFVFFISVMFVLLPFYLIYSLSELILYKITGESEEIK